MASALEYHVGVRRSSLASIALCGMPALLAVLVCNAGAQINGAPSSVTSPGFGGRAINGTPSSVTSLGRNGYGPGFPGPIAGSGQNHQRHNRYGYYPPLYTLPVPYAVDIGNTDNYADADDRDPDYQGGPTIFDRRGAGADSYVPPVRDVPRPHAAQADDESPTSQSLQDPTILVFKDGHNLEVGNYAIVGATLFDLTPGHARRIALSDLDLEATRKQNDEHGVVFELPASPQASY